MFLISNSVTKIISIVSSEPTIQMPVRFSIKYIDNTNYNKLLIFYIEFDGKYLELEFNYKEGDSQGILISCELINYHEKFQIIDGIYTLSEDISKDIPLFDLNNGFQIEPTKNPYIVKKSTHDFGLIKYENAIQINFSTSKSNKKFTIGEKILIGLDTDNNLNEIVILNLSDIEEDLINLKLSDQENKKYDLSSETLKYLKETRNLS
ncbi:MAG: hypothetical protein ABI721_01110 [Candidatus Dojkabacteria bacterium]